MKQEQRPDDRDDPSAEKAEPTQRPLPEPTCKGMASNGEDED